MDKTLIILSDQENNAHYASPSKTYTQSNNAA
jgi:hypothetical protein